MPQTRSATKQARLEDFTDDHEGTSKLQFKTTAAAEGKRKKNVEAKPSVKHKLAHSEIKSDNPVSKKTRTGDDHKAHQPPTTDTSDDLEKPIVINRAPVLQLWGATVASFLHPELAWTTCLSVGNAISSLCAISKGKAIGMIEPKDEESAKQNKHKQKTKGGTEEVEVMGFSLHLKNEVVELDGKSKALKEDTLKNKYGDRQYERVKEAMSQALESWSNEKDELNKKAFHMYETFRPDVAQGQKGWGRKGELNLTKVANTIKS